MPATAAITAPSAASELTVDLARVADRVGIARETDHARAERVPAIADASGSSASNTRRSSAVWCAAIRALAATYRSKLPCQSRWSGVIASTTATRGRNVSEHASWNDDTSATDHVDRRRRPRR